MSGEIERIDRVWELLREQECLPFMARIRDIVPEERPMTDQETKELRVADTEAEQKNREFCRQIVEAAQDFKVSRVGEPETSRDAIVPEEWVDAGLAAARGAAADIIFGEQSSRTAGDVQRAATVAALEAVVPLAEQRTTRSLLEARAKTEGR